MTRPDPIKTVTKGSRVKYADEVVTVLSKCQDDYTGNWFCGHDGKTFANNFQMHGHTAEHPTHPIGWNCHGHGPEVP